jgi:hypothetical protein
MPDELDHAITAVTELARVPENARDRFRQLLLDVIGEANTRHAAMRIAESPHPDIDSFVNPVITAARDLNAALVRLQDEISNSGKRSAAALKAAHFFRALLIARLAEEAGFVDEDADWPAIAKLERSHTAWLAEYRRSVSKLIPAATLRGRPKTEFHWFVRRLFQIERMTGARWTHSKVTDLAKWYGPLQKALEILRPFLPSDGFFPRGNLGRSLEHLCKRMRTCAN